MSSPPSPFPVADAVAALWVSMNAAITRELARRGFPELKPSHGIVFEHIGSGARVSALAEKAGMTSQGMGQMVMQLESLGYLERVVDPTDGRATLVRCTRRGSEAASVGRDVLTEMHTRLARRLGKKRYEALVTALAEVIAIAGSEPPRAGSAPAASRSARRRQRPPAR